MKAKTDTGGDGQQGGRVQLLPLVHCGRQGPERLEPQPQARGGDSPFSDQKQKRPCPGQTRSLVGDATAVGG